jgi:hypothetical protein
MEPCTKLEQRADPAPDLDATLCRLDDPRDDSEQRALARAVAPDEAEPASGGDGEGDVAQRPHVDVPAARAQQGRAL